MVPVEKLEGLFDHFLHELVPALLAVLVEAAAAEVVLVFAISLPGMMAEFESRAEAAIGEERGAETGSEGNGKFHAIAFDGSVALDGGVISQANRLLPAFLQFCFEREVVPGRVEVRG